MEKLKWDRGTTRKRYGGSCACGVFEKYTGTERLGKDARGPPWRCQSDRRWKIILDELYIRHSAGKLMKDVAMTLEDEVGDGTVSAILLTSELLVKADVLVRKKVHPVLIIEGYQKASDEAIRTLE
ncbi:MAG: TCP-1/cpn60 chaperonin family protein [Candidatus Bathyarchaeia archaeon]